MNKVIVSGKEEHNKQSKYVRLDDSISIRTFISSSRSTTSGKRLVFQQPSILATLQHSTSSGANSIDDLSNVCQSIPSSIAPTLIFPHHRFLQFFNKLDSSINQRITTRKAPFTTYCNQVILRAVSMRLHQHLSYIYYSMSLFLAFPFHFIS